LHDFRVAIRRLRSHLRAYREQLPLRNKRHKALRRLARGTNPARDTEVAVAWLRSQLPALGAVERADAEAFIADLLAPSNGTRIDPTRAVLEDWPPLAARLRKRLQRHLKRRRACHGPGTKGTGISFGRATAGCARAQTARLGKSLRRIRSLADPQVAHRARIQTKRLRYLLEPWRDVLPSAVAVVERLRRLQDALGELHDGQVLGERLAAAMDPGADPLSRPGLTHLSALLRVQQVERFSTLEREHLGAPIDTLVDEARAVADIIASWPHPETSTAV